MLSRSYIGSRSVSDVISTMRANPPLVPSLWNPLAAALNANTWAREGFGSLENEWQSFIGRQLQQNYALIQRLSQSRTSNQVVSAYTDFWQQMAENCGKEFIAVTKLMTGLTNRMVMATQMMSQEQRRKRAPPVST